MQRLQKSMETGIRTQVSFLPWKFLFHWTLHPLACFFLDSSVPILAVQWTKICPSSKRKCLESRPWLGGQSMFLGSGRCTSIIPYLSICLKRALQLLLGLTTAIGRNSALSKCQMVASHGFSPINVLATVREVGNCLGNSVLSYSLCGHSTGS